jgi:branched-chain amino acid transport system ATP-binding protein
LLSVERLNAYYGRVQVLHDIDLTVDTGQIVALVGANAAGKSTLMFSLAGLHTRCTGRISIDGEPLNGMRAGSTSSIRALVDVRLDPAMK